MPESKKKALSTALKARQHTFTVSKSAISTRKRAKFDSKRREEVKAVRKRRSCLRCSLLKIKCSDDDLCATCAQLASIVKKHEKVVLSFCGCIRTKLSEVSVFEIYLTGPEAPQMIDKSIESTLSGISLDFESQVSWNLGALVDDAVAWLNKPGLNKTSKVRTLSSPQLSRLIDGCFDLKEGAAFQQMIYASSRAYEGGDGPLLTSKELRYFGAIAGQEFLALLDRMLKPSSLAGYSQNQLQIMFLWLFGTILAVGYALPDSIAYVNQHFSNMVVMQNHLCQILGHYLLFIGNQLGLPIEPSTHQFLLEAASTRWLREGVFMWEPPSASSLSSARSPYDTDRHAYGRRNGEFSQLDSDAGSIRKTILCCSRICWSSTSSPFYKSLHNSGMSDMSGTNPAEISKVHQFPSDDFSLQDALMQNEGSSNFSYIGYDSSSKAEYHWSTMSIEECRAKSMGSGMICISGKGTVPSDGSFRIPSPSHEELNEPFGCYSTMNHIHASLQSSRPNLLERPQGRSHYLALQTLLKTVCLRRTKDVVMLDSSKLLA